MAVTVYRSTDSSAPTLSGTAGDLVNLLDKCLVAGYGSKTAAGWTKPYTATNKAVFRMGGGNSFYLDVDDSGPGAGTTQEAQFRGYETMSAVATGTGPFPTVAQIALGIYVRKSAAATSTTRTWTMVADDRTFYLFLQAGDTPGMWGGYAFGDFYSYLAGTDNYRTLIIGRAATGGGFGTENLDKIAATSFISAGVAGHYVSRAYNGLGGSQNNGKFGDTAKTNSASTASLVGGMALPNPVDGNVWIAPVLLNDTTAVGIRGRMRGFMHWLHTVASFADQDTVTGAGGYAGRTFLLFKTTGNSAAYCIDITGPWDAN